MWKCPSSLLGLGETSEAWLSIGGRGIDTSYSNWNQYDVGAAILRSGVPREELFITTKIPGCYAVDTYVQKNLEQLGLRYLDMVLLEFSMPYRLCAQSWHQLEKLVEEGVIRAIGVSNFRRVWLGALMEVATVKPAVHQIELSVFHPNWDTVEVSHAYNIKTQAYTPFGSESVQKRIVGNAVVQQIAQNHKVTPRQVALRWLLQRQHLLVITSVMVKHQLIDADVFSFNLLPEELDELDRLGDS